MADIVWAGPTRTYTTISGAVAAANPGDIVGIDPGTYIEQVTINKHVSLRGNTKTPENGDIILKGDQPEPTSPIIIDYEPTSAKSIYIEGMQVERETGDTWSRVIKVAGANSNLSIYLNRLILRPNQNEYAAFIHPVDVTALGAFYFEYINVIELGNYYAVFTDIDWRTIGTAEINKCYFESMARFCYSCDGSPDVSDYVETPTAGYGPASGSYYTSLGVETSPASIDHLHDFESPIIIQSHNLTTQETYHTFDAAHFPFSTDLTIQPADHIFSAEEASVELFLYLAEIYHTHAIEQPALSQAHVISPAETYHLLVSGDPFSIDISVQAAYHLNVIDKVQLLTATFGFMYVHVSSKKPEITVSSKKPYIEASHG